MYVAGVWDVTMQLLGGVISKCGYGYQDIGAHELVFPSNPLEWINFTEIPQSFWDRGDPPHSLPGQKAFWIHHKRVPIEQLRMETSFVRRFLS